MNKIVVTGIIAFILGAAVSLGYTYLGSKNQQEVGNSKTVTEESKKIK